MKRVSFATIRLQLDFPTEESAKQYVRSNQGKGWHFSDVGKFTDTPDAHGNMWTVEVHKPYKDYPTGY